MRSGSAFLAAAATAAAAADADMGSALIAVSMPGVGGVRIVVTTGARGADFSPAGRRPRHSCVGGHESRRVAARDSGVCSGMAMLAGCCRPDSLVSPFVGLVVTVAVRENYGYGEGGSRLSTLI